MRSLPERPDLRQLKIQAKDLVKAVQAADPDALSRVAPYFSPPISLTQAQLVVARELGFDSWSGLKASIERHRDIENWQQAIRAGDLAKVQTLMRRAPDLAEVRLPRCNHGNGFSFASQWGQLEIAKWLADQGPRDLQHALSRAAMRGHWDVVSYLVDQGADPGGPYSADHEGYSVIEAVVEAMNSDGLRRLVEMGARLRWTDEKGHEHSVPGLLLTIYSRNAIAKADGLELCAEKGIPFPETPVMALHRRRFDLLERFISTDANVLNRRFRRDEIFPKALGIEPEDGVCGAPIEGATLLHLAVEFDDPEMAEWLLKKGSDPNARTSEQGHSPLFHAVITFGERTDRLARLLVANGAQPGLRATVRKGLGEAAGPELADERIFEDVTALQFGAADWPEWLANPAAVEFLRSGQPPAISRLTR